MNTRKHTNIWSFIALALLLALLTAPAFAQDPSADEINEVAKKLSCPTCTGINVADCPTETCAQWRAKIGEMLVEGKGEQEILDYLAWLVYLLRGWSRQTAAEKGEHPQGAAVVAPSGTAEDGENIEDEYLQRVQQDLEKLS
jgi:hypothetical protein